MSFEELSAQTTREAPSAPMRETSIAPTLLPVCCICGLIRDCLLYTSDAADEEDSVDLVHLGLSCSSG